MYWTNDKLFEASIWKLSSFSLEHTDFKGIFSGEHFGRLLQNSLASVKVPPLMGPPTLKQVPIVLFHKTLKNGEKNITFWRNWIKGKIFESFKFSRFQIWLPLPPPPEIRLDQNLELLAILKHAVLHWTVLHPPGLVSDNETARISFLLNRIFFCGERGRYAISFCSLSKPFKNASPCDSLNAMKATSLHMLSKPNDPPNKPIYYVF